MRVNALRVFSCCDIRRRFDDGFLVRIIFQQRREKTFIARAVDNNQLAALNLRHILRSRLIAVRVGADGQQRLNRQALARDVARDVGDDGGGSKYC